jgi:hypothetical protein
MTELKKSEVIESKKGEHYRFVSLENTEPEAKLLCEQLVKKGFQPATFQRNDNKFFEVFVKFSKAEELIYLLERKHCDACPPGKKAECDIKTCKVKSSIEDVNWKERLGFYSLISHDLKKLREAEVKTNE